MTRGRRLATAAAWVLPPLVLWLWALSPVVQGEETFFLRDVFGAHLGLRLEVDRALSDGHAPLAAEERLGQPLAGNPNAVAFYPTALLHLVLPFFPAFDAHLWLHLLAAPFGTAWLGRELGLGRRAAWAAGVCYGFSGFLVSNAAFFNLIAGVVLAPAVAAAVLATLRRAERGIGAAAPAAAAAGLLWSLELVAGDPATAAMTAAIAALVAIPRLAASGGAARAGAGVLAAGLAAGTLVALPQIVEFLRLLPASARGVLGFVERVRGAGSFDPRQALDWLLPFAFGRPDRIGPGSFWGYRLYQGSWPFYFTLYPGIAALALVAAGLPASRRPAGAPGRRAARLGLALAAVGLFFALGAFNPAVAWLLDLPLAGAYRYPLKAWLLVAVGLALVCGAGFERAVVAGDAAARHRAAAVAGIGSVLYLAALGALRAGPDAAAALLHGWMPRRTPAALTAAEIARWSELCLVGAAVALAVLGLVVLARTRPGGAGAALVALHAASQLVVLRPALATDWVAPYLPEPEIFAALPPEEVVVHGAAQDLFGESSLSDGVYPQPLARWMYRRAAYEAYPFAGALHGRTYDLVTSPEALDPLPTRRAVGAMKQADGDRERLRLLAAWGVGRLVLGRALAPGDAVGLAEPVLDLPSFGQRVHVYRMVGAAAPEVYAAERVVAVGDPDDADEAMLAPGFRPGRDAVVVRGGGPGEIPTLPPGLGAGGATEDVGPAGGPIGGGGGGDGAGEADGVRPPRSAGSPRVERGPADDGRLVAEVSAPRPTVLVWRRAWVPLYRATVDGRPVATFAANVHHLGVPVPAGTHRVEVRPDRRPLAAAAAGAAAGLALLAALAGWGAAARRRR